MDSLANGDETKYEFYEGLNVFHFLNLLTYRIEKAAEEKRIAEMQRLKQRRHG